MRQRTLRRLMHKFTAGGSVPPPYFAARPKPFPFPGASLHLDFVNGRYYRKDIGIVYSLSAAGITFGRTTQAWYENAAGDYVAAAINEAVREFSDGVCRGLRIEEARTNQVRNPTMAGVVAGTPGTAPTNWSVTGSGNGVTRQIVGSGSENGIPYVDVRFFGTPTAGSSVQVAFEAANVVSAASGQTWALSSFVSLNAGSLANTSVTLSALETNGSSGITDNSSAIIPAPGVLKAQRWVRVATLSNAGTTHIQPRVRIGYTVGQEFDLTLRIGAPQLGQGAHATSPIILGGGAAVARAADIAVMTSVNFSSWYESAGLFLSSVQRGSTGTSIQTLFSVNDGTSSNRRSLAFEPPANIRLQCLQNTAGAGLNVLNTANQHVSGRNRAAMRLSPSGTAICLNGGGVVESSLYSVPSMNQLSIGNQLGSGFLNGFIEDLIFIPGSKINPILVAASK